MKSSGIVRRIDELGRIVIPKGIRNKLRINEGDRLEINMNENIIEIQKYNAYHLNFETITNILITLEKEIKIPILIINDQKVLTMSVNVPNEIIAGDEITQEIYNRLFNLKIIEVNNYPLINKGRKHSFTLIPLSYNSEILGGIVMFDINIPNESMRIVQAFRNLITMTLKV